MRVLLSVIAISLAAASLADAKDTTEQSRPGGGYRLASEASPYLRQHADNPVEWYPWGKEAFERAKKENKPIFLSVGYSTCFWCHVMKRESFEKEAVGKLLNADFISVKVDRERRPDVDATYMIATELITQRGGWPNSVFLTPDLKPFFALTYAPEAEFTQLLGQIASTWKGEEKALRADATRVASLISRVMSRKQAAVKITPELLTRASLTVLSGFDAFNGGTGTAPKFPREQLLSFLYHRAIRDSDAVALDAFELTLDNIIRGGINDHVAGGFHRYATDNAWAVPHFEKMLYNQAQIGRLLIQAYQLTGRQKYAEAARKTFDFVLRDMTTSEGGFASAFDAETDGKEGLFYLWSKEDFDKALGGDAPFAAQVFGVTKDGNHEHMNTLRFVAPLDELARDAGLEQKAFNEKVEGVLAKLRAVRIERPALRRDDKVIANWNAAMIRTLTEASVVLDEPRYLQAAQQAMTLLVKRLGAGTVDMQRAYFEGTTGLAASQADHALTGLAAVALYDATAEEKWRDLAKKSASIIIDTFADPDSGDFYLTKGETGFVRTKQYDDGDLQAGNAAALELFSLLTRRDQNPRWGHAADGLAAALGGLARRTPMAMASTLVAADIHERGEVGSRQSLGKGAVRISAERSKDGKSARVILKLAPGWHINANKPTEDFLIPTVVKVSNADSNNTGAIDYPTAIKRKLGFHPQPLDLYEGTVAIEVPASQLSAKPTTAQRLTLSLQACSDSLCLEPESAELLLPAISR
ncbi:MAG: DUF255 domain-containing protein [Alphaproteobacteria bacterium]|nr:DUF255 domain-containing protein [Alphaproteobacteria bacterium]